MLPVVKRGNTGGGAVCGGDAFRFKEAEFEGVWKMIQWAIGNTPSGIKSEAVVEAHTHTHTHTHTRKLGSR